MFERLFLRTLAANDRAHELLDVHQVVEFQVEVKHCPDRPVAGYQAL